MFGRNKNTSTDHRAAALAMSLLLATRELEVWHGYAKDLPTTSHEEEMAKIAGVASMKERIDLANRMLDKAAKDGLIPPAMNEQSKIVTERTLERLSDAYAEEQGRDIFADRAARRTRLRGGKTGEDLLEEIARTNRKGPKE